MHDVHRLADRVDADEHLVWRGRHLDVDLLLEIGDDSSLVSIRQGRVTSVRALPIVMACWTFALRADRHTWEQFCSPLPPPGYHDVFALLRAKRLRLEGDLQPFMTNILYFKGLLAKLRVEVDS